MDFIANEFPNKTALITGKVTVTFAELKALVHTLSEQLSKLPQGVLILNAEGSIEFIKLFLAALTIGQPVALFTNQLPPSERQMRLDLLGNAMTVDTAGNLSEHYKNETIAAHPQLALVLFTSGTTGQVKAVQLSKQNIYTNCMAVMTALNFSRMENQLLFLPLSYSFGLLGQLLPALMAGITTHLINQFTDIKALLEQEQVPHMWSGVPSHWVAINRMAAAYPASAAKIRSIISAGAPLPVALRKELKQTFPNAIIYNNYGLTEASPRVLTYSSEDLLFFEAYAGYPIGDWQIKLSADQELLVQGNQVMLGYLGDEQNSKIQEDWLFTGDVAEILPSGLVAIKGRKDNLVNIGGEKVSLNEIEQKIAQLEGIKEILVLPLEDPIYGVRLVAWVEKNNVPENTTEQQLTERIRAHLLPRILPLSAHFLDKLPRNHHGKLDRNALLSSNAFDSKGDDNDN